MIELDPVKDEDNRRKHGLPLEAAEFLFDGPYIEEEDRRGNYGETRFVATGPVERLDNRVCVAVYTWRQGVRRIISFRKANDREIRTYHSRHASRG
jgi:uncharacterized DUF497 family protein